jgi:membrane-bound lytic murein transglycosylase D
LARLADTSTAALTELNPQFFRGVTPPRQTSIVRVPRGTGTLVATRYAELPPSERVTFVSHTIARGETLSEIAARYRVNVQLITSANRGLQARRLRIGQRITIPLSMAGRAAAGRSTSRSSSAVAATPSTIPEGGAHTVRPGESLWVIAQRYGLRVSDLRLWNELGGSDVLRVGQRLAIKPPANGQ